MLCRNKGVQSNLDDKRCKASHNCRDSNFAFLQVNFAHNKLSGEVPSTLQQLAAVRPVRVTMKDG